MCKMIKFLYRLKQSRDKGPRDLSRLKFTRNECDYCVYFRKLF